VESVIELLPNGWKTIIDCMPDQLFILSSYGEILYANKSRDGIEPESFLGKSYWELLPLEEGLKIKSAIHSVLYTGQQFELEVRGGSIAGRERWYRQKLSPVKISKDLVVFILMETDITDKKFIEQLVEFERARALHSSKMASLGEMAGGIAHEINNPLAVIQLKADSVIESMQNGSSSKEKVIDAAVKIQTTVTRISKIISGLRSFARSGDRDPLVDTSVRSVISDALELCRERFRFEGVRIDIEDIPAHLLLPCRPGQIIQVILNLLNNALDAALNSRDRWVRIDIREIADKVEIAVVDSGSGVPEEFRSEIMQPFFTTKEIGKGTGLGLSISKGLVESHRGMLVADFSYPNTRFVVVLPKFRISEAVANA
jgi:PAS domain S-box-containing protein